MKGVTPYFFFHAYLFTESCKAPEKINFAKKLFSVSAGVLLELYFACLITTGHTFGEQGPLSVRLSGREGKSGTLWSN